MKFTRFEQLVLVVGGAAILGAIALSLPNGAPEPVELLAQVMLFAVLLAAVKFGRRGGLVAAVIGSVAYVILRIPVLGMDNLSGAVLLLLTTRLLAFGLVGVVGGEAFMRLKYAFAKIEGRSGVDDWSRVYNQAYIRNSLEQARSRYGRYGEFVSVVIVSIAHSITADLTPARQRALVRGVADHVRSDIRMVDEVGRLDDGRFLVVLPHTPKAGALVVVDRLAAGIRHTLGAKDESVSVKSVSLPEDRDAYDGLLALLPESKGQASEDSSGSYSSAGDMTLNPAVESVSSAAGSSTLNTSTAASPEGSTKQ